MTRQLRASLALVASMAFFAASYTLTKIALVDVAPMTLGLVRFALATVLIGGWLLVRGGLQRPTRADARTLALGGLLGVTGYFALENLGVAWASATDATLLGAAFPAIMAVADVVLNKARIPAMGWVGIALAIVGSMAIVLGAPVDLEASSKRLWGCLLMLVGGVVWALYTFTTRDVSRRYSSWTTVLWQDGVGAVGFLPLALTETGSWHAPAHPLATGVSVLGLTVFCSALAMVCYAVAVQQLSTAVVAASLNLVPLFGLVIALVVLREHVGAWQLVGAVVVLAGVVLTHRA